MSAEYNPFEHRKGLSEEERKAAEADAEAYFLEFLGDAVAARRRTEENEDEQDMSFEEKSEIFGLTAQDRALIPADSIDAYERVNAAMYTVGDICGMYGADLDKTGLVMRQSLETIFEGKRITVLEGFARPETHAIAMDKVTDEFWMAGVLYKK